MLKQCAPYKDHPIRKLLAPSKSILDAYKAAEKGGGDMTAAEVEYREAYLARLDSQKWVIIGEVLKLIRRGGEFTFLCWEHAGNFCHRNLFFEWLADNGYGLYISGQDQAGLKTAGLTFVSGAKNYGDEHFDMCLKSLDKMPWRPSRLLLTNTPGVSEIAALWAGAKGIPVEYLTPASRNPKDIAEQIFNTAEAIGVLWDSDPSLPDEFNEKVHEHLDSLYLKFEKRDKTLVYWEDFAKARELGLLAA